MKSRLGEEVL